MKKYLFLISFILITVVFSGCFNEKNTASFDNQTERNFTVSENSTDTEKSTNDLITANNQNTILLNEPDNSIQNILRYSLDNRSILKRPNLGSKLKNQTEINTADNASFDKNILGTYKVIFFGSQVVKVDNAILGSVVDMYYISNDCRNRGATLRFWETMYDVLIRKNAMTSPHGWTAWKIYAIYYFQIFLYTHLVLFFLDH